MILLLLIIAQPPGYTLFLSTHTSYILAHLLFPVRSETLTHLPFLKESYSCYPCHDKYLSGPQGEQSYVGPRSIKFQNLPNEVTLGEKTSFTLCVKVKNLQGSKELLTDSQKLPCLQLYAFHKLSLDLRYSPPEPVTSLPLRSRSAVGSTTGFFIKISHCFRHSGVPLPEKQLNLLMPTATR